MLDPVVKALEGSLGKRTYLCGNPDCGTLIIFHTSGARPVICHRCGAEIDWEGEYVTRIKICPKCNNEYDTNPKNEFNEKNILILTTKFAPRLNNFCC